MVGHQRLGLRTVLQDLGAQALGGLSEEGRERSCAVRESLPSGCISDARKPEGLWKGLPQWSVARVDPRGREQWAPASALHLLTAPARHSGGEHSDSVTHPENG